MEIVEGKMKITKEYLVDLYDDELRDIEIMCSQELFRRTTLSKIQNHNKTIDKQPFVEKYNKGGVSVLNVKQVINSWASEKNIIVKSDNNSFFLSIEKEEYCFLNYSISEKQALGIIEGLKLNSYVDSIFKRIVFCSKKYIDNEIERVKDKIIKNEISTNYLNTELKELMDFSCYKKEI